MDTIRYLPDFLIQNLNSVTIMIAFIPLILFTMNIFLIKKKMKIDNSRYYYHYTTKIGFEKIRQTKTIEGVIMDLFMQLQILTIETLVIHYSPEAKKNIS